MMFTDLHPSSRTILGEMYSADALIGTESPHPVPLQKSTRISQAQGQAIHNFMREHSVKNSLEIGFAYGFSTVWIIDALRSQANSRHIAIDPFERQWGGVGLKQVERLDFDFNFQWIEDYSIHVLSDMIRKKQTFDFVYVDGNHKFDDVLVDFYLADKVLRCQGFLALDDMWMRSLRTVSSFIRSNRAYVEVPQSSRNMIILQKQREDDRDWQHFEPFDVATERGALFKIAARGSGHYASFWQAADLVEALGLSL